jgi:hypothetical protein
MVWVESEHAYCFVDRHRKTSLGWPVVCHANLEMLRAMPVGLHDGEPFTFCSRLGYDCTVFLGPRENDQRSCYAMRKIKQKVYRYDLGSTNDLTFEFLEQVAATFFVPIEGFKAETIRAYNLKQWDEEYRFCFDNNKQGWEYEEWCNPFRHRAREEGREWRHQHTYGFAGFGASTERLDALRTMGFDAMPSASNLKRRYYDLAKKYHPDRGGDTAMMAKINAANDLLKKCVAA